MLRNPVKRSLARELEGKSLSKWKGCNTPTPIRVLHVVNYEQSVHIHQMKHKTVQEHGGT